MESLGEWYVGPSGCGKTTLVREKYADNSVDFVRTRGVVPNIDGKVLILDDYSLQCGLKRDQDIQLFRDYPGKIVVTSQYPIEECFSGAELEMFKRRFEVIKMDHAPEHREYIGEWVVGETQCDANDYIDEKYDVNPACGYHGDPNLFFFLDFYPSHYMWLIKKMLNLNPSQRMVVTSRFTMEECFKKSVLKEMQLKFKTVHIPYNEAREAKKRKYYGRPKVAFETIEEEWLQNLPNRLFLTPEEIQVNYALAEDLDKIDTSASSWNRYRL